LFRLLTDAEGNDQVIIYVEDIRAKKVLPRNRNVLADKNLIELLEKEFGEGNIRVVV